MIDDKFVLMRKSTFVDGHVHDDQSAFFVKSPSKNDCVFTGKFDPSKVCNYSREKGHWKLDRPVLKNNADEWMVSMILKVADQWDDESITGGYMSRQELVDTGGTTHLNMRLG